MYTPAKEVCEPFILKREHIERLVEIIELRAPMRQPENYKPLFRYARLDDYERSTHDLNDVFNEDNHGETRISRLEITNKTFKDEDHECELNYKITFTSLEDKTAYDSYFGRFKSIKFEVRGENRDESELLFNNINKYIFNTIVTKQYKGLVHFVRAIRFSNIMPFIFLLMIATLFFTFYRTMNSTVQNEMLLTAIASSDISVKLNAILQKLYESSTSVHLDRFMGINIGVGILVLVIISISMSDKAKRKFASNLPFIFAFGISPENYETRFRKFKWFIGIVITLILGVIGNYIYNALTK